MTQLNVAIFKTKLINEFKFCILDNMIGPVGVTTLYGQNRTFTATKTRLPQPLVDESDEDYSHRVAEFIRLLYPEYRFFAFYRYDCVVGNISFDIRDQHFLNYGIIF